jgi:hypothetical protein
LPLAQIATASPRRFTNQSVVSAISGANMAEQPRKPMNRPCASMKVQMLPALPAAANPNPMPTPAMESGTMMP